MKKAVVRVAKHPDTGLVITPSDRNPEFGTIRLDAEQNVFSNGFFSVQKRTAFVRGRVTDLESLGLKDGQVLTGQIVRKESFEPFYTKSDGTPQEPKINPTTGEVVLTDGRPTYLDFEYTEDMSKPSEIWVDNSVVAETTDVLAEQSMD